MQKLDLPAFWKGGWGWNRANTPPPTQIAAVGAVDDMHKSWAKFQYLGVDRDRVQVFLAWFHPFPPFQNAGKSSFLAFKIEFFGF